MADLTTPSGVSELPALSETEEGYTELVAAVAAKLAAAPRPLFRAGSGDAIWAAYLEHLPPTRRGHYRCQACAHFLRRYGGLVTVNQDGSLTSAVWPETGTGLFAPVVPVLKTVAERTRPVTGVLVVKDRTLGTPVTGAWTHLHGVLPVGHAHTLVTLTPGQRAAEVAEEVKMLAKALADYPPAVAAEAVRLLKSGALVRAERAVGPAEWFAGAHEAVAGLGGDRRKNVLWDLAASAPAGFAHVSGSVVGTLMADVAANLSLDEIRRKWGAKLAPDRYQRPTAAPADGTIDQAEKVFAALGLAPALARRAATLEDVLAVATPYWVPPPPAAPKPNAGGVFGHLRQDQTAEVAKADIPRANVTWAKFLRDVVPAARRMEVSVPAHGNFFGLTTAADPAAPPLLQWDVVADGRVRNPVAAYVYVGGSSAAQWALTAGGWAGVRAVVAGPPHWQEPDKFTNHGKVVNFVLTGARDTRAPSLALFPETLRGELRPVRSVIEAHSNRDKLLAPEAGTANGLVFSGEKSPVTVRVTDAAGGRAAYTLDRWE